MSTQPARRPNLTICPASRLTVPVQLHDLAPADPHCPPKGATHRACGWVVCRACGWVVDGRTGATMPGPKASPPSPPFRH